MCRDNSPCLKWKELLTLCWTQFYWQGSLGNDALSHSSSFSSHQWQCETTTNNQCSLMQLRTPVTVTGATDGMSAQLSQPTPDWTWVSLRSPPGPGLREARGPSVDPGPAAPPGASTCTYEHSTEKCTQKTWKGSNSEIQLPCFIGPSQQTSPSNFKLFNISTWEFNITWAPKLELSSHIPTGF